jgi:hypothetical protein
VEEVCEGLMPPDPARGYGEGQPSARILLQATRESLTGSMVKKGLLLGGPRLYHTSKGRLDVYFDELSLADSISVSPQSAKTAELRTKVACVMMLNMQSMICAGIRIRKYTFGSVSRRRCCCYASSPAACQH